MRRAVEDAEPFQRFPAFQFDLAGKDLRRRMLDQVEPGQTVDVRGDDISDPELAQRQRDRQIPAGADFEHR